MNSSPSHNDDIIVDSKPDFTAQLIFWYENHGRQSLPWKIDYLSSQDPYFVWLSEIMLQQTQVKTVLDYYASFTQHYPNIIAMADDSLENVMRLWSGLGYYARAKNLHKTAQLVKDNYQGNFPLEYEELIALPGIGRSTASAIIAFCTGRSYAILDGNVKRVLQRLYGIEAHYSSKNIENKLWHLAQHHTPDSAKEVQLYTQAIMDFGATVCNRKPKCLDTNYKCFMQHHCFAYQQSKQLSIPPPKPKKNKPSKFIYVLMISNQHNHVYLEHRPKSGIWSNLWSLPELELLDDDLLSVLEKSNKKSPRQKLDIIHKGMQENIINSLNPRIFSVLEKHLGIISYFNMTKATGLLMPHLEVKNVIKHSFSHYNLFMLPIFIPIDAIMQKTEVFRVEDNQVNERQISYNIDNRNLGRWIDKHKDVLNNSPLPAPILSLLKQDND